jgi:hypothetical protein
MDYAFGEQAYDTWRVIETIQGYFTECGIGFYYGEKQEFLKVKRRYYDSNALINEGTADNYFSIMN